MDFVTKLNPQAVYENHLLEETAKEEFQKWLKKHNGLREYRYLIALKILSLPGKARLSIIRKDTGIKCEYETWIGIRNWWKASISKRKIVEGEIRLKAVFRLFLKAKKKSNLMVKAPVVFTFDIRYIFPEKWQWVASLKDLHKFRFFPFSPNSFEIEAPLQWQSFYGENPYIAH